MFMIDPTRRGVIHFAAYAAGAVLISLAVGWSVYEVGATLVRVTNDAILDGSGRAEPEAASMTAAAPQQASDADDSQKTAQPPSSAARPIVPPTWVSSDDSRYDLGYGTSGLYRTYCVRLCDGFYWPISSATTSDRLDRDADACQSSCDGPARLFVHPASRGGPGTMTSLEGLPYTSLKTAFQFRSRYDEQCRCRPQPWSEAATDRHRLYAARAAARKGNRTAADEAKRLAAKIDAERTQSEAARDAANAQADRQLAADADNPNREIARRSRPPLDGGEAMGLGMQEPKETRRGGFAPASGSNRSWVERVFSGN